MNKQTEALKMAIEALQNIDNWLPTIGQRGLRDYEADALQACKEAIISDVTDIDVGEIAQPVQEPVAVITPDNYGEPRLDFIGTFKYKATTAVNPDIPLYTHPAPPQEPVAKIEVFNLLTKNGAFAIKEEWLWNIRYINSKGIIREFPNEYPSEKKYAIQSAKYWADFLNCKIVEVDNRGNK